MQHLTTLPPQTTNHCHSNRRDSIGKKPKRTLKHCYRNVFGPGAVLYIHTYSTPCPLLLFEGSDMATITVRNIFCRLDSLIEQHRHRRQYQEHQCMSCQHDSWFCSLKLKTALTHIKTHISNITFHESFCIDLWSMY